jgi:hypothetical protein
MVGSRVLVALAIASAARVAHADEPPPPDPDVLVKEGEDLARGGEYSRAIERFKQADALRPRARNACLVGLAYTRREFWPQAEIFFASCKARATVDDPAPDWLPEAEATLAAKIAEVAVAAVELRVEPGGAEALLSVSSFLPDELFAPRTIHLPPGTHVIKASAPGFATTSETVEVNSREPVTVTITLVPAGTGTEAKPKPPPPPEAEWKRSKVPRYLLIGAGAAAVAGAVFHGLAYRERGELVDAVDANDLARYDEHEGTFDTYRAATFAFYGAAVAAGAIGAVLYFTDTRPAETIAVTPTAGGAMLTIGWER